MKQRDQGRIRDTREAILAALTCIVARPVGRPYSTVDELAAYLVEAAACRQVTS